MKKEFYTTAEAAEYLNATEGEIILAAAYEGLPVCFRYYGRVGLFRLTADGEAIFPALYQSPDEIELKMLPFTDIKPGIYRSLMRPWVLQAKPLTVVLHPTSIEAVRLFGGSPFDVPCGHVLCRVDEISRLMDDSPVEASEWLFCREDLDRMAGDSDTPAQEQSDDTRSGTSEKAAPEVTLDDDGQGGKGLVAWQAVMLEKWPKIAEHNKKPPARAVMKWLRENGPHDTFPEGQNNRDSLLWIDTYGQLHTLTLRRIGTVLSEWRQTGKISA